MDALLCKICIGHFIA